MDLVIYNFVDSQGRGLVSIGSKRYMDERLKNSRQLVNYLGRSMELSDFEEMKTWSKQKLYEVLMATMEKNELYVFYPN